MPSLNQIDHFVVLMLENRSFDNLFGLLPYPPARGFDGLSGKEFNLDSTGAKHFAKSATDNPRMAWIPEPDPGENFTDINEQIFGNPDASGPATMGGFVTNYQKQKDAGAGSADDIMHSFAPGDVPALTTLAQSFAVCDRWFASAPCQTWPNRFFLHTGTAAGYVNNSPPQFPYEMPTIFNALEAVAPSGWGIYFHDFPQSLTLSKLWTHLDHFHSFDDFLSDAQSGHLPSYAFIEPRYFPDLDWPNDMHPPHNVAYGDRLVQAVYEAVRNSPCWESTMLIITFDEHGGCYDHVPPPAVVAPTTPPPNVPKQATGVAGRPFNFDRLGVRVPAVVISPYIAPGTIFRSTVEQPFDHTAIIKTLRKRFGVAQPLTDRDAAAPDLESVLNLDSPTNGGPPTLGAAPVPGDDNGEALEQARLAPLTPFQKAVHDASMYLVPLIHGVAPQSHIATLLAQNFAPPTTEPSNAIDALQSIKNLIAKLFA